MKNNRLSLVLKLIIFTGSTLDFFCVLIDFNSIFSFSSVFNFISRSTCCLQRKMLSDHVDSNYAIRGIRAFSMHISRGYHYFNVKELASDINLVGIPRKLRRKWKNYAKLMGKIALTKYVPTLRAPCTVVHGGHIHFDLDFVLKI